MVDLQNKFIIYEIQQLLVSRVSTYMYRKFHCNDYNLYRFFLCFIFIRSERRSYYKHREKAISNPEKYACIVQDGMDQAKLLLPRFTVIAHAYANARQLRTHLTGILNHGRQPKGYFDLFQYPHDANLTINILLLELKSMDYLPDVLCLQLDNCWRENKNQFVLNFLAILVKLDIFKKV